MLASRLLVAATLAATILEAGIAQGQTYPNKPIRIITGSVGGGSDTAARHIAQEISGPLGQPVIVENRASIVATETVARAAPDGYVLLVGGASVWHTPLMQKMNYDPVADFAPLTLISREVFIVVVHPSLPVKSVRELIALAKARPGELNNSAGSTGGTVHLAGELFKSMAGINVVGVPYKGTAPAIGAMLSGEVQMTINEVGLLAPHIKSGKMKALAVTSITPSALVPGLPTVAASGIPGYEWVGMTHFKVPAKTPAAIINRLNQEIVRVLHRPEVKERYLNAGVEAVGNSPEEFAAMVKADLAKVSKVIALAGIKTQ
jgi:tripartite-type tricarboxylate transporter receptor subunit TctC